METPNLFIRVDLIKEFGQREVGACEDSCMLICCLPKKGFKPSSLSISDFIWCYQRLEPGVGDFHLNDHAAFKVADCARFSSR